MDSPVLPTPSKQQFDKIITKFEKIERTALGQKAAMYEIKKAKKAYRQFEKKKSGIETGWFMMTDLGEEETLRVLIFDGPIELTQTLTHEGLTYPLDNPSIRIPAPSPYIGYVIVADRIVLKKVRKNLFQSHTAIIEAMSEKDVELCEKSMAVNVGFTKKLIPYSRSNI